MSTEQQTPTTTAEEQLAAIEALIAEHRDQVHLYHADTPAAKVRAILAYYRDGATRHVTASRTLRDDIIAHLRAMSLVVEMTGGAHTHAEKAARLRGMSELLESAIAKLRDVQFGDLSRYWQWPDVFRSDYPTRKLLDEIADLKRRLAAHEGPAPEAYAKAGDDEMPF